MTRHGTNRGISAVAAALAAISVTACGQTRPAGPLQTLSGGGQPLLAIASMVVVPGQSADGEAYVFNTAHAAIRVTGISAVAVPGEPTGQLIHVGIQSTGAEVAAMRGWPSVPTRPLIGADLPQGQVGIVFGISGSQAGRNYAVAGVQIRYTYRGQSYSVIAWSAFAACVVRSQQSATTSCRPFTDKVNGIVEKMAGV